MGKNKPFNQITVRDIALVLAKHESSPSMANLIRSTAVEIWKDAMREGWTKENTPEITRTQSYEVKRSRLTLDDFNRIYAVALKHKNTFIARAMELALVTAQRREDLSLMEFRQGGNSSAWIADGFLYVIQQKTQQKLRIKLDTGINNLTLDGIIKSCRNSIVSKWIIHHEHRSVRAKPGDAVKGQLMAKLFAECRDEAKVTGEPGKTPPSLHEIRSLAIRLYTKTYGVEFAQAIAGHKNAKVTALYQDTRGSEWVQVMVA